MGDVHDKWLLLMQRLVITDDLDTLSEDRRSRMIIKNVICFALLLFTGIRLGTDLMPFFGNLPHFFFGNTLINTGNVINLIMLLAIVTGLQMVVYRYLVLCFLRSGDMRLMPILRSLQLEADQELLSKKRALANAVYWGVLISSAMAFVVGNTFMLGLLYFNLINSNSLTEQLAWFFWYTQDVLGTITFIVTLFFLPSTWLLLVLFYRMDLRMTLDKIDRLISRRPRGTSSLLSVITAMILDLERKADHINRFSSPILSVVMTCSSTLAGVCLFLCVFTNITFFRIIFPALGLAFSFSSIVLQAVAGDVSEKSAEVHVLLDRLAGRSVMDVATKKRLLQLMERVNSEKQRLALYTATGERCTSLSLIVSLLETGLQFSLLYNFSGYLKLTGIY